ncbi:MAG: Hsp70 family protein, partial [Pseudonocardiaceae bacterium]
MTYQLGVDLGTTTVAAAVRRNGHAEMIALGDSASEMPTALFRRYDGTFIVGEAAEDAARDEPSRGVRDFLRHLDDPMPIMVGGAPFTRSELVTEILGHVRTRAIEQQGSPPADVVLTHPATWAPHQVASLVASATDAGFVEPRTIDRLEATARHHVAQQPTTGDGVFAVYFLGGATFEVGLYRRSDDTFVRLGQPQGIDHLGGVRFDQAVSSLATASLNGAMDTLDPADPATAGFVAEFQTRCMAAKERLSSAERTPIHVPLGDRSTVISLERPEFEVLIRPLLSQTIDMVRRAAASAGLAVESLNSIVAAGGAASVPLVTRMLEDEFSRPVLTDSAPAQVTALGAITEMGAALTPDPAMSA